MTPGIYNYGNQYRGDTLTSTQFTILAGETPVDITDAAIRCQFRSPFNGKTIKELSIGNGITVVDSAGGVFSIDNFVVDWDAAVYMYDIEFTFPNGVIKTYVKGNINVISDTTI